MSASVSRGQPTGHDVREQVERERRRGHDVSIQDVERHDRPADGQDDGPKGLVTRSAQLEAQRACTDQYVAHEHAERADALGMTAYWSGSTDAAIEAFVQTVSAAEIVGNHTARIYALGYLAAIAAERGVSRRPNA